MPFQLAALSVGIYGATQLETDFNYIDYVNEGTYVRDYLEVMQSHYSSASGASGTVYIGGEGLDFSANMAKVKSIIQVSWNVMLYWNHQRGHPYMTSAKFWDFLTPPVRIWD